MTQLAWERVIQHQLYFKQGKKKAFCLLKWIVLTCMICLRILKVLTIILLVLENNSLDYIVHLCAVKVKVIIVQRLLMFIILWNMAERSHNTSIIYQSVLYMVWILYFFQFDLDILSRCINLTQKWYHCVCLITTFK